MGFPSYQNLLFKTFFFYLTILNSADAICVPRNSSNAHPLPHARVSGLSRALRGSSTTNLALEKICHSTDYPSLCVSSISPFLKGEIDPSSVLKLAIRRSAHHTKLAMYEITKMINSPRISSQKVSILHDCADSYEDALDNFQKALVALPEKDTGTMNSMLSAAITDYGDCDDEFDQKSPLSKYSEKLTHMVSNCLAIVTLIN